jgi:hypothetical protein
LLQATAAESLTRVVRLSGHARTGVFRSTWAHHPYPARAQRPRRSHRALNVGFKSLARFDNVGSFRRASRALITSTRSRGQPSGAQIADDLRRAIELASSVPEVNMFIWFMLQNHHDEPWQSGLVGSNIQFLQRGIAALDPRNSRLA